MTTSDLPLPVNHVFVDYENVREIDPAIIGRKTFHITVLLGAHKSKFDGTVVEQLVQHASTVEIVRLESSGRNALDFALAYYLGRAVLADPAGCFHLISRDKGYDPLVEHLHNKHIRVSRHDDFTALSSPASARPTAPVTPPPPGIKSTPPAKTRTRRLPKAEPNPKAQPMVIKEWTHRMVEHLRKPATNRPRNKNRLLSCLLTHLGHKLTEADALSVVDNLSQGGHLAIDEKGKVTYRLDSK